MPPEYAAAEQRRREAAELEAAYKRLGVTDPALRGEHEDLGVDAVAALPSLAHGNAMPDASERYAGIGLGNLYQELAPNAAGELKPTGTVRRKLSSDFANAANDPSVRGHGLSDLVSAAGDAIARYGREGLQIPLTALGLSGAAKRNAAAIAADEQAGGRQSTVGDFLGSLGGGIGGAVAGGLGGLVAGGPLGAAVGAGLGGMGLDMGGHAAASVLNEGGSLPHAAASALGGAALGTGLGAITGGVGGALARGAGAAAAREGASSVERGVAAVLARNPRLTNAVAGGIALPAANTGGEALAHTLDPTGFAAPDTSLGNLALQAGLGAFFGYRHPTEVAGVPPEAGTAPPAEGSAPVEEPPPSPTGPPAPDEAPDSVGPQPDAAAFWQQQQAEAGRNPMVPVEGAAAEPPPGYSSYRAEPMPEGAVGFPRAPIDADYSEVRHLGAPEQPAGIEGLLGYTRRLEAPRSYEQGALRMIGADPNSNGDIAPPNGALQRPTGSPADNLLASLGQQPDMQPGAALPAPEAPTAAPAPATPVGGEPARAPAPEPAAEPASPAAEVTPSSSAQAEMSLDTPPAGDTERLYPEAARTIYEARRAAGGAPEGLNPGRPLEGVPLPVVNAMIARGGSGVAHVARVEKALRSPAYAAAHPEIRNAAQALRLLPRSTLSQMAGEGRADSALPFDQILGAHAEAEIERRGTLSPEQADQDIIEHQRQIFKDCFGNG